MKYQRVHVHSIRNTSSIKSERHSTGIQQRGNRISSEIKNNLFLTL